jgi:stage III sporulation protein AG
MDISMSRSKIVSWFRKYRYVAIVLLVGILLMLIPTGAKKNDESISVDQGSEEPHLEITPEELECLLSQIKGAGNVKVLLSCSGGERTVFLTDERTSSSDNSLSRESETVLTSGSNRAEDAIVAQVMAPEYLGAVIVCEGGDDPIVKYAVADAVSKVTGLGTNRIAVLKMK